MKRYTALCCCSPGAALVLVHRWHASTLPPLLAAVCPICFVLLWLGPLGASRSNHLSDLKTKECQRATPVAST